MRRAFTVLGWGLAVATLVKAWLDVSTPWDAWYYHLPFAARLAGIVPAATYVFSAENQARYAGFPLFAEFLQGALWRIFGRAEAANLVAWSSVMAYAGFVRAWFGVRFSLSWIALLAIPLVQTHATSTYVDLPANMAAAALVMLAIRAIALRARPSVAEGLLSAGLLAVVVNTRFQLQPLSAVVAIALSVRFFPPLGRWASDRVARGERARVALVALLGVATLAVVFYTPLRNTWAYRNPFYPMSLPLPWISVPHAEEVYRSSPVYLEHAPGVVRWLFSVLEVGVRPLGDPRRWTIDQWAPADDPAYRMGGFFGAYVVFHLAMLCVNLVVRRRAGGVARGVAQRGALSFAVFSGLIAVMPQAHELRYYMVWMIVLVSLNLAAAAFPGREAAAPAAPPDPAVAFSRVLAAGCVAALFTVAAVTRGDYLLASRYGFSQLVADKVDPGELNGAGQGATICVSREPWTFLYAAPFHGRRDYVVREAPSPEDCAVARPLSASGAP